MDTPLIQKDPTVKLMVEFILLPDGEQPPPSTILISRAYKSRETVVVIKKYRQAGSMSPGYLADMNERRFFK
jgi:hypothetical protein